MKKLSGFILTTLLAAFLMSVSVTASSSNSVSKKAKAEQGCPIGSEYASGGDVITSGSGYRPVYLKILPQSGIDEGSSIIIGIKNGVFKPDIYPMPEYCSPLGNSYDQMMQSYKGGEDLTGVLKENLCGASCELPYKIVNTSPYELEAELFPVPVSECDKTGNDITYDRVYYYIPIHAIAEGLGDVKITLDANESNVTGGGTFTIAEATASAPFVLGDADGSGVLTASDAAYIMQCVLDSSYIKNFDVLDADRDGILTASDAALVLQMVLYGDSVNNQAVSSQSLVISRCNDGKYFANDYYTTEDLAYCLSSEDDLEAFYSDYGGMDREFTALLKESYGEEPFKNQNIMVVSMMTPNMNDETKVKYIKTEGNTVTAGIDTVYQAIGYEVYDIRCVVFNVGKSCNRINLALDSYKTVASDEGEAVVLDSSGALSYTAPADGAISWTKE